MGFLLRKWRQDAGQGAGQQGFASAGRADQEDVHRLDGREALVYPEIHLVVSHDMGEEV